ERQQVAVVAYSPFGHDAFPAAQSRGGQVLARVAAEHGASARQVALAFLLRAAAVFAIPKAVTPAHVEDNAAAGKLELRPEDIAALDAAFPRGPEPAYLPTI